MSHSGMSDANSPGGRWDETLARWIWLGRPRPTTIGESTRRRVWVHLLPILFILYILAFIDRSNISIAKFGMNRPVAEQGLGFDDNIVGLGGAIFFWGYWILEIPSTLSVSRFGARWVFFRILVLWGAVAVLMGFMGMPLLAALFGWLPSLPVAESVPGLGWVARHWNSLGESPESQFYFLRFMLGFFEGGFFPAVLMYLSMWFKAEHRAKAIASFMAALPISLVIGTPLSEWIGQHIHWAGLAGWRWIYILEGVAPILAGIAVLFCLPDRPESAKWLPEEEKVWLLRELEAERREREKREAGGGRKHVFLVLLLTVAYFTQAASLYGIIFFMPSIVKAFAGTSETAAAWITSAFFLLTFLGMQLNGWHSDRTLERTWHVAVPLIVAGCGLAAVSFLGSAPLTAICILFLTIGTSLYTHLPAFWPIPTIFLGSTAAASAIGFINMIGNFGGSLGSIIVGDAAKNQDFSTGLWRLAPFPLIAAAVILGMSYWSSRRRPSSPRETAVK